MKMLTSSGIGTLISVARIVVATGHTLLSNSGTAPTGLVAPVSGGHSSSLSVCICPMMAIKVFRSSLGSMGSPI
jgi:hypothetical protein